MYKISKKIDKLFYLEIKELEEKIARSKEEEEGTGISSDLAKKGVKKDAAPYKPKVIQSSLNLKSYLLFQDGKFSAKFRKISKLHERNECSPSVKVAGFEWYASLIFLRDKYSS